MNSVYDLRVAAKFMAEWKSPFKFIKLNTSEAAPSPKYVTAILSSPDILKPYPAPLA